MHTKPKGFAMSFSAIPILPMLVVMGVMYLLMLPFVAGAAVLVRKRMQMRSENHPDSAIDRATSSIIADVIEMVPPWRYAVTVRPLAIPIIILGPVLFALSILGIGVLMAIVMVTVLIGNLFDDSGTLLRKTPSSQQR